MCDLSEKLVLVCGACDVLGSLNTGVKETLGSYKFSRDVINTCIISNSKFGHKKICDHCPPFSFVTMKIANNKIKLVVKFATLIPHDTICAISPP